MSVDPRVCELEALLAKIRAAATTQLGYDSWDRHGAAHASPEYRAEMEAGLAEANRTMAAAKVALETLVAKTRVDAPDAIAAWVSAHDQYLAAFVDDCRARGDVSNTGIMVAQRERAEWAAVRDGGRAFVDENVYYVTENAELYRTLFGIDPDTLERV